MPKVPKKKVKKVIEGITEGKTQKQAMLDAGYSESYSNNPHLLKKGMAWEEILSTTFSDDLIATKQRGLLEHKKEKLVKFPINTPDQEIYDLFKLCGGECLHIGDEIRKTSAGIFKWRTGVGWVIDVDMMDKQIEKIYKLKGYYKNSDISSTTNIYTASLEDLKKMEEELDKEDRLFNERLKEYAPTKGLGESGEDTPTKGSSSKGDTKGKDKAKKG